MLLGSVHRTHSPGPHNTASDHTLLGHDALVHWHSGQWESCWKPLPHRTPTNNLKISVNGTFYKNIFLWEYIASPLPMTYKRTV